MFQGIVAGALRQRGVVVALAALLLAIGAASARRARLDVFPDFAPPQAVVQTEAPGLAAEQVEQLVTAPVEQALLGSGGVVALRSDSIQGLSIVTAVFADGADPWRARQLVTESLAEIGAQLPRGVRAPTVSPLTSATMDLLKIGLVSERVSPMALRTLADWTLRPRLLSVPGVARANVFGGEIRQLQVRVRTPDLLARGLSLADVAAAAGRATAVAGAGFVDTRTQRVVIETEGQAPTPAELAQAVVAERGGTPITIGDLASVVEGAAPRVGDSLVQGRPGVLLTLSSQYGANTLEVTRAVEAALAELRPALERQGITLYPALHRPANFIEAALANLRSSLLLGVALVAVLLFAALGSARTALVSLTAIPLSLLAAVLVLEATGTTLDTMTLGGLVIALGEVVDDAIIDVENIVRRLRTRAPGAPAAGVVLAASLEVRSSVVFATLAVIAVFVPVLLLPGIEGRFFAPLAASYVLAVSASLLVALTVTPALASLLLGGRRAPRGEPALQRRLRAAYRRLLLAALDRPRALLAGSLALLALAAVRAPFLERALLPTFREGHFVVQATMAPGTSLDEMLRMGRQVSSELLALPAVATVEQQAGRAAQGEDPWGPNRSELHVELAPDADGDAAEDAIRAVLDGIPGVGFELLTFLGDRIGESISGETAELAISVFGDDLDALDRGAAEVARVVAALPGAADVRIKAPSGTPRLRVRVLRDRLARLGYTPGDVLDAVQAASQGATVAQTYEANRVTDVVVLLDPDERREPEELGGLLIANAAGRRVRLDELAAVELASARDLIAHDGTRRRQVVTANPQGVDVVRFQRDAEQRLARDARLPAGTYLEFAGTARARVEAQRRLLGGAAAAALCVALLLRVALGSWRAMAIVLANLPGALCGGIFALTLAGWLGGADLGELSLGSLVGFATLFGITARSAIMLLSHLDGMVRGEGRPWSRETVVAAAVDRVVPVSITALVTALALLPLALGSRAAGREIEGPLAIVILGGLATSTALTLLVVPSLAERWGRPPD